jgi:hypothetical protein
MIVKITGKINKHEHIKPLHDMIMEGARKAAEERRVRWLAMRKAKTERRAKQELYKAKQRAEKAIKRARDKRERRKHEKHMGTQQRKSGTVY